MTGRFSDDDDLPFTGLRFDNADSDFTATEKEKPYNQFRTEEEEGLPQTDAEIIRELSETMTIEDAKQILRKAIEEHESDPNIPEYKMSYLKQLVNPSEHSDMFQESIIHNIKFEAALIHYHSPYLEVRAVVDSFDDPKIPVETMRAYLLGIVWVIVATGVNQFFEPRQPPVYLSGPLLQLLLYPSGMILQKLLPDWGFTIRNKRYTLNPGPWSYKEQTLVTIMFSITTNLAYVNDMVYVQRMPLFYNNRWAGFGYQFTLFMSTQFLGFGMAGLTKHILVYPVKCLWPNNFPVLALNRALMKPEINTTHDGWTISRYKFFFCSAGIMFSYFWFPNYLFEALSTFNWLTWISPQNFNLAAVTGSATGLGINPLSTFDWNIIDSLASPLQTPFYSLANQFSGALFAVVCVIPAIYWSNTRFTAYLPINTNQIFDNTGNTYDVQAILKDNGEFDPKKYNQYSPPFYSAANLVMYGAYFTIYPAMFVQALINYRKTFLDGFKSMFKSLIGKLSYVNNFDDAHSKLMRNYKEVPIYWFLIVMILAFIMAIICVEVYPTETPIWGLIMAITLSLVFVVPIGLLYSTANSLVGLNVLAELIAGYALPGRGIAVMIIKAFGLNTNVQAIMFAQDQKLGHYAKIPPRATFRAQIIASFIEILVIMGVANWQIDNYPYLCDASDPWTLRTKFTCPSQVVVYSSSVIWGIIGPRKVFNVLYPSLPWCFLLGLFIPIIYTGVLKVLYVKSKPLYRKVQKFDPVLFLYGMVQYVAPYNLSYILGSFYVSLIFMKYIRRNYTVWFERYVYVLSGGLSAGMGLSALIIFFAVQYRPVYLSWWGNDVPYAGIDGGNYGDREYPGLLPIPDTGYFGPDPGSF